MKKEVLLIGIVMVLFIGGCGREIPNPETHNCFEITCCKSGYKPPLPLIEPTECKDESYNWDVDGNCQIGYFGGCRKFEEKDFWFEQYDKLSKKLDNEILQNLMWECIEWDNKTTINLKYFENCCIDLDINLIGGNKQEYKTTIDNKEFNIKLSNQQNNTLYKGGGICFDSSDDYESINIGNQSINISKCLLTPKKIDSNETIYVKKELKNY